MKTPREIILDQHRHAESKLANIRPEDLAAHARDAVKTENHKSPGGSIVSEIVRNFWRQSILPWRRAWMGLAALWIGMLAANLLTHAAPHVAATQMARAESPVVLAQLREQRQLMAQLLGPPAEPANPPAKIPGPRSSLRIELLIV